MKHTQKSRATKPLKRDGGRKERCVFRFRARRLIRMQCMPVSDREMIVKLYAASPVRFAKSLPYPRRPGAEERMRTGNEML